MNDMNPVLAPLLGIGTWLLIVGVVLFGGLLFILGFLLPWFVFRIAQRTKHLENLHRLEGTLKIMADQSVRMEAYLSQIANRASAVESRLSSTDRHLDQLVRPHAALLRAYQIPGA